jgi:flagellar biosynthesis anti-sigma factor FlgM
MEDNMKIDDPHAQPASVHSVSRSEANNNASKARAKQVSTADTAASADSVDLNSLSRIFSHAQTAGERARAARIEQLRHLFATGHVNVDSQELSSAIIDAHLLGG